VLDIADVFALSNIAGIQLSDQDHLLLLSQESGTVLEVDRSGHIYSSLTIPLLTTDPLGSTVPTGLTGTTLSVADQQHEGLTMDDDGFLYMVSENGGGSIDNPQLWVYAPVPEPGAFALMLAAIGLLAASRLRRPITLQGRTHMIRTILGIAVALSLATSARAAIFVSEVHPSGSGTATYAADFFELTNDGPTSVDITGWRMDDNSNLFANAVALRGVTAIGAGKSVVFFEGTPAGTTDATIAANFISAWFGGTAPAGFTIGAYGGSGVGLSTAGDAVNIFDAGGNRITGVSFGAATTGVTLDNSAGLGSTTLPLPTVSTLSAVGVHGAFASRAGEIGSPGTVVPEPGTALLLSTGLAAVLSRSRRRTLA
jgi:hypothetical protein